MLTQQMKRAATIEALLCTFNAYQHEFNDIHLSACWISLNRFGKRQLAEKQRVRKNVQVASGRPGTEK